MVAANRNGPEPEPDPGDERRRTINNTIRATRPAWEAWPGVCGLLYAKRPRSTPPLVVRDITTEGLCAKITLAEKTRGLA